MPYGALAITDEAMSAASGNRPPCCVKVISATIAHKTEVGGVVLICALTKKWNRLLPGSQRTMDKSWRKREMKGVLVQEMITGGVEVIVSIAQDPSFGPLILFGTRGIYTSYLMK